MIKKKKEKIKSTQLFPSKPHQLENRKMKSVRRVAHTYEDTPLAACGMCYFFLSCYGSLDCIVLQTALQLFLPQDAVSVTAAAKSLAASTAGTDWSLPSPSVMCLTCHCHVLWSPVWPKACRLLHGEGRNTPHPTWGVALLPRFPGRAAGAVNISELAFFIGFGFDVVMVCILKFVSLF